MRRMLSRKSYVHDILRIDGMVSYGTEKGLPQGTDLRWRPTQIRLSTIQYVGFRIRRNAHGASLMYC